MSDHILHDDVLRYTISETAVRLGNISHRTLHYYEDELGLKINRDGSGNRVYSEDDIYIFETAFELKKKGVTMKGIKAFFQEKNILPPEEYKNIVVIDEKAIEIKNFLVSEIRQAVSLQFKEEMAETNLKLEQVLEANRELQEIIEKMQINSNDHYSKIDEQLTAWREKSLSESDNSTSEDSSWFKRLFKGK